jgi:acyl-CoA thioester hydrolase
MAREQFRFSHSLRVRWAEVDMQGVVFNGHYLTYFDVGFTEYWRGTGLETLQEQAQAGRELFARKCTIEYHAPARFDDMVAVHVRCAKMGNSSMLIALEIHREAPGVTEHLISGELVYVYVETKQRRPIPLPDAWREALRAFETSPIES